MNYAKIKYADTGNGYGVRTSLFVSGCAHHCKCCFNEELWNFGYGEEFTPSVQTAIINSLAPEYISGLSILGGEPLHPSNAPTLLPFLKEVRKAYPQKTIWIFTGYDYPELIRMMCDTPEIMEILHLTDYLKFGPYIDALHEEGLLFRGSTNQKIIHYPSGTVF